MFGYGWKGGRIAIRRGGFPPSLRHFVDEGIQRDDFPFVKICIVFLSSLVLSFKERMCLCGSVEVKFTFITVMHD